MKYILSLVALLTSLTNLQADPNADLLQAAYRGDVSGMQNALDAGANLETTCPSTGRTALHFAAQGFSIPAVDFLLQKGANKNVRDNEGWSASTVAAFYASRYGFNNAMADYLVAQGISL